MTSLTERKRDRLFQRERKPITPEEQIEIYERRIAGPVGARRETYASIAWDYDVTYGRIRDICQSQRSHHRRDLIEYFSSIPNMLSAASGNWEEFRHVRSITVEQDQLSVLPELPWEFKDEAFVEWAYELKLPFPTTWIEIAGENDIRPFHQLTLGESEDITPCGILATEHPNRLVLTPYASATIQSVEPIGTVTLSDCNPPVFAPTKPEFEAGCILACNDFFKFQYLLGAANVYLDEEPTQRQTTTAHGDFPPSLVVHLKRGPRKESVARGGTVEYSHQFGTIGHYKSHGLETPIGANSDKLEYVEGKGMCARVWCPPFVKGPVDAPYVPKARILDKDCRV